MPDARADPDHSLILQLPLTVDGQIDADAMARAGEYACAEMTKAGAIVWSSPVLALDTGWALRPEPTEESPLWRMEARTLRPGDYLTLHPDRGPEQVYRIVNVEAF